MKVERFISYKINKRNIRKNYSKISLKIVIYLILFGSISILTTSEIHLIITGSGDNQPIINGGFNIAPSEVWINEVENEGCRGSKTCQLTGNPNNVVLKFNDQLESCLEMFKELTNIKEVDLSYFDATKVVDMGHMFHGCSNLQKITLGNVDTSHVTNMGQLFEGCSSLTTIDLINLKTNEVTNMESTFNWCSSLVSIDISHFDTSKVTSMAWMFNDCQKLESINFGNIDTSSLETTWNMFSECYQLTSIDLSNLNLAKVSNMETMFNACSNLETINFGNTNVASPTNLKETFRECDKLVSLDLSHWDFSKVNTMVLMFYNCDILEHVKFGKVNTPSVIDLEKIFQKCRKIKEVDFSPLGNSKVLKLDWMFEGCYSLETVNFGELDTSLVDNLNGFFCGCISLLIMDLNNFNTSSVTGMEYMFKDCFNLKSLDLSTFDITKVNNMNHMFYNCSSLVFLNLANFTKVGNPNIADLFGELPPNVKFCIIDNETRSYLFGENSERNSICNDQCFQITNPKIQMDTKECLSSCSESSSNKFEYMNGCYVKCPDGTLLDGFNCSSNECEGKPNSAICKDGTPIGYYYDTTDKIYKKCYEKCNYCNGEGTETNNNCIECKDNLRLLNDTFNITNCYAICEHYYYFDNSNDFHCTESNSCPPEYSKLIEEKGQCICEEIIQTTLLKEVTTIITEALTVKPTPTIPITEYNPITTAMISTAISSPPMISTTISSTPMISTEISSPPMISSAISSASPQNPDTIRESENIIASSKTISTSNIVTDANIVENTFNLEQYGCVRNNPLTLTCSMEETRDNSEVYDILVNDIL